LSAYVDTGFIKPISFITDAASTRAACCDLSK
jgi:hypothetical protein